MIDMIMYDPELAQATLAALAKIIPEQSPHTSAEGMCSNGASSYSGECVIDGTRYRTWGGYLVDEIVTADAAIPAEVARGDIYTRPDDMYTNRSKNIYDDSIGNYRPTIDASCSNRGDIPLISPDAIKVWEQDFSYMAGCLA